MDTIDTLNRWSEAWAGYMGVHFKETAVAFLVIAALWMLLHKRVSPQVGYWLFLLILLKGLLPIQVTIPPYLHYLSPQQVIVNAAKWTESAPSQPFEAVGDQNFVQEPTDGSSQHFVPNSNPASTVLETQSAKSTLLTSGHSIRQPTLIALGMLSWAAAVLFFLGRLVWMQWRYSRIIQTMRTIDPQILPVDWEELKSRLRLRRPVRLVSCPAITIPAISGVVRSHLIIPPDFFQSFSSHQARWILLHELAHVQRLDTLVAMMQKIVQSVFFFNPVIWLTNWMIDQQREYACDDIALATCGAPRLDCGQGFLSLALRNSHRPSFAVGALGLFNHNTLVRRRMMRILDTQRKLHLGLSFGAMALVLGAALLVLPSLRAAEPSDLINESVGSSAASDSAISSTQNTSSFFKNTARMIEIPENFTVYEVSPDGNSLICTDVFGQFLVLNLATAETNLISDSGNDINVVWSSDNSRIAFTDFATRDENLYCTLIIRDMKKRESQQVFEYNKNEYIHLSDWSNDGKYIAGIMNTFNNQNQYELSISILALETKEIIRLEPLNSRTDSRTKPFFSPDSKSLAFVTPDNVIHIRSVIDSSHSQYKEFPEDIDGLLWSADGRYLLAQGHNNEGGHLWALQVSDGCVIGLPFLVMENFGKNNIMKRVAGESFAFYESPDYQLSQTLVYNLDQETGQIDDAPRLIGFTNRPAHTWSPQNQIMQLELGCIRIYSVDGHLLKMIHINPSPDADDEVRYINDVVCSSDGTFLLGDGFDKNNKHGIFKISLATPTIEFIRKSELGVYSASYLSVDDKDSPVVIRLNGELYFVSSDPTKPEKIIEEGRLPDTYVGLYSLSDDKSKVAYVEEKAISGFMGHYCLKVYSRAEHKSWELIRYRGYWNYINNIVNLDWSPNGKFIAYAADKIRVISTLNEEMSAVSLPEGFILNGYSKIRWSPDGKHLLVTASQEKKGKLWIIDNFAIKARENVNIPAQAKSERLPALRAAHVELKSVPSLEKFEYAKQTNLAYMPFVDETNIVYTLAQDGVLLGSRPFSDRTYEITEFPEPYKGLTLFKTLYGHRGFWDEDFSFTFALDEPTYIFVAVDERLVQYWKGVGKPEWIKEFVATDEHIKISDQDNREGYRIYYRKANPGVSKLGPPCGVRRQALGTYFAFFGVERKSE